MASRSSKCCLKEFKAAQLARTRREEGLGRITTRNLTSRLIYIKIYLLPY